MSRKRIYKLLLCFSFVIAICTGCSADGQTSSDLQTTIEETTISAQNTTDGTTQTTVQTTPAQTEETSDQAVTATTASTVQPPKTTAAQDLPIESSEATTAQTETESSANLTSEEVVPIEYPALTSLTADEELKLKEDFAKYMSSVWTNPTVEEMTVIDYYGKYDGCEVVMMYSMEYTMTEDIKFIDVGEYTFALPSGSLEMLLHADGDFIDIQTAYAEGYLNDEDIAAIYYYANNE